MSYDDKSLATRPPEREAKPWDTAAHGAPDPSWPIDAQLRWYSRYSHILLLNSSENLRKTAAAQGDREALPLVDWDIDRGADVLHSEHHSGTFVPTLDSCAEHDRADYVARVRKQSARGFTSQPG